MATDIYLPPNDKAPTLAIRTPYGRTAYRESFAALVNQGYAVISQDCRGTGDSEPDSWDYYMYEREDSLDLVDWITQQDWYGGFLGSLGGSYVASTQWCMAVHPRMSTIAPEVGGFGVSAHTARFYMFLNAYSRSVGKGTDKLPVSAEVMERQMQTETLAGGYFNEPLEMPLAQSLFDRFPELRSLSSSERKRWLWERYSRLDPADRAALVKLALGVNTVTSGDVEALPSVFGHRIAHDAHALPRVQDSDIARSLRAPALMITGWYDWCLDDAFATWELLTREAPDSVASRSRLLITPGAHNKPGYHEGKEDHPELERIYRTPQIIDLLLHWYSAVRNGTLDSWPAVTYYLMGANEWRATSTWPPTEAQTLKLFLGTGGTLSAAVPQGPSNPDTFTYVPDDPTPTVGGSIVSYVYCPGSIDVSQVQRRPDVLTYTTEVLQSSLDIVGPIRLVLYAASSAVDTDFSARLSDVFPDGRAIQLQSGILRVRYRNANGDPELIEPGRVYRFDIDMCATANRFKTGHQIRLDISSADFPKFDRNANRGGESGPPIPAMQTVYHDQEYQSHMLVSVVGRGH